MSKLDLRFRQVHLDFHTSPDIDQVAIDFDPEQFAATLEKARVDSITCFARCHHGHLYYDSKLNPERIHPGLTNRNLLKEQIESCHKRGIRVPIYITVQWDYYTSMEHPEWVSVTGDGGILAAAELDVQEPFVPGFYQTLCLNSPYRDFLKAHTKEVLETFDAADGLFFDILFPTGCACKHCRKEMVERGYKPHIAEERMAYSQVMINEFKLEMTEFVRQYNKDCSIYYNRGHVGTAHRSVVDAYSHFELETLPSGHWGYLHFPITMRYVRTLGLDCLAQTGKFHTMWGDFHSFKNQAALEFECFNMLSLGAKAMIGDQLDPNGKLSEPVYELIGSVYEQIEKKEPWCRQVTPVTEIGVFTAEEFTAAEAGNLPVSIRGVTRMLQESAQQFDVLDSKSDFSKYKLLVMPDNIPVSDEFAAKLGEYLQSGGKLIASFESGMDHGKTKFNIPQLGIKLNENPTTDIYGELVRGKYFERFDYADYIIPQNEIGRSLPQTEHAMYMKGVEVRAEAGAEVLAQAILSYFDRTYAHFCSHRQTPSSGKPGYDAIVKNGNVIYFAHPIFTQYNKNAPRWVKQLFLNAVEMLMGQSLLEHDGPSTMLATVNAQEAENRWVAHLLHYIPERRSENIDIIEDVIPLYNVSLSIDAPKKIQSVTCVPEGTELGFTVQDGRVEFTVPEVRGHQMVSIQFAE